jgi:hypothetical protein
MRRYSTCVKYGLSGAIVGGTTGVFNVYNTLSRYKFYGEYVPDSRLIDALNRRVNVEMSGKDFNTIYKYKTHIKFFNEKGQHYDMVYTDGLNIDILPFYPLGYCNHGGLYFVEDTDDNTTKYKSLLTLLNARYKRRVYVPDHARVYVEHDMAYMYDKYKANMIVLGPKMEISPHII